MSNISFVKSVPVGTEYDVIVCGGGPSGFAAAVSSARKGAKTLLVEKNIFTGGMWTAGLVNPLFDGSGKPGIMAEVLDKLKQRDAWGGFWDICFKYETMKTIMDEMLTESGVHLLFDTFISDVITEGGVIKGVVTEGRGGSVFYPGKIFIDATGDAVIAEKSGVRCFVGDEKGDVQSCTLMFRIGNVNFLQKGADELRIMMEKAISDYNLPYRLPFDKPYVIQIPGTNMAVVQLTHIYHLNPLDGFAVSEAVIEGRKQANDAFEVMKKYIPLFRDCILIDTAPMFGIRETRRIEGETTITVEDCINGTHPEDSICECRFNIDIHEAGSDKQTNIHTKPYGIPFRALIPKGVSNLLVAGKTISGSHKAMASYRVTGDCVAMGEAAGKAAAIASQNDINVRQVNIRDIIS